MFTMFYMKGVCKTLSLAVTLLFVSYSLHGCSFRTAETPTEKPEQDNQPEEPGQSEEAWEAIIEDVPCCSVDPFAAKMSAPRRLLLTSNGPDENSALQDELRRMIGATPEMKTCWYIPTAALNDGWSQGSIDGKVKSIKKNYGLGRVEIIDPECVKGEELSRKIRDLGRIDVIWAEMGNTYALRHHLRDSGGEEHLRRAVDEGTIYVGSSAASINAGSSVRMAFWKDWDDKTAGGSIQDNWDDDAVARGLDLAGGRNFFPHANDRYANRQWQEEMARQHDTPNTVILADGDGYVVDGGKAYPVRQGGRCQCQWT